jgi:hypothetical protein
MATDGKWIKIWKEAEEAYRSYYHGILLEGLRKTTTKYFTATD